MQPISAAAAAAFAGAAQTSDNAEHAAARPMPRLGRGIVWSTITAEIEHDQQESAATPAGGA